MIFKFFKRATDKDAIEKMVHQPPLGKDWDWNVCPACDQKEIYFVIPIKNESFWFCGLCGSKFQTSAVNYTYLLEWDKSMDDQLAIDFVKKNKDLIKKYDS